MIIVTVLLVIALFGSWLFAALMLRRAALMIRALRTTLDSQHRLINAQHENMMLLERKLATGERSLHPDTKVQCAPAQGVN